MAEAIYKVGDILEIENMYGMFSSGVKTRCLVLKCIHPGYEFIIYSLLIYKSDESFTVMGLNQKELFHSARKVGHIDISSFLGNEESTEPDYAMFFTAATVAQAADLRNENEKLKAENKALSDTLSKSEEKAQSRLDRNEVLKRENEELRGHNEKLEQALSKSIEKADSRLDRISFLVSKVDKLEAENKRITDIGTKYEGTIVSAEDDLSKVMTTIYGIRKQLNQALNSN